MTKEPSQYVAELLSEDKFILYWPKISRELDKVPHIWQDWWTKDSIYRFTTEGRFQCWAVGTEEVVLGVLFSQVTAYPKQTVLQVFMAFGEGMLDMVDALEATFHRYAVIRRCTRVEITGRPGWESELRKKGFRRTSTTIARAIQPMEMN